MLRRLALLAVLLLTLSVVTPAVFACDTAGSCCPPGAPPCKSHATAQLACCLEQPVIASALATSCVRKLEFRDVLNDLPTDLILPHGPGAVGSPAAPRACKHSAVCLPRFLPEIPGQQQLYLHTGRLRL